MFLVQNESASAIITPGDDNKTNMMSVFFFTIVTRYLPRTIKVMRVVWMYSRNKIMAHVSMIDEFSKAWQMLNMFLNLFIFYWIRNDPFEGMI